MPDVDLPFTRAEYAARLAKARSAMAAAGVEVLFTCDPSNMAWLTGYDGMTFHFMPALWTEDWGLEITEPLLIREQGPAECLADYPRKLFVKP